MTSVIIILAIFAFIIWWMISVIHCLIKIANNTDVIVKDIKKGK